MAVLNDLEVTILANGTAAQEYDDDEDSKVGNEFETELADKFVSTYIQVVSGAEFCLMFNIRPTFDFNCDFLTWDINLDGKCVLRPAVFQHSWNNIVGSIDVRDGIKTCHGDNWTLQKFKFADITTHDGSDGQDEKASLESFKHLGTITVSVWRHHRQPVQPVQLEQAGQFRPGRGLPEVSSIPEKALKGRALSLSTSLGPAERSGPTTSVLGQKLDNDPIAKFQFKYRSKRSLQELLILPRTPSPIPLDQRPIEELDQEEMRQLLRRHRAATEAQDEKPKIKRERPVSGSMTSTPGPSKARRRGSSSNSADVNDDSEVETVLSRPARAARPTGEIEVVDLD